MALDSTRLGNAIKPLIESNIRSYILSGDATSYPNLTNFSKALAEAIASAVVSEITTNAVVSVDVTSLTVNAGTFVSGVTPITGTGNTTAATKTGTIA
jgi:hypothetical protein